MERTLVAKIYADKESFGGKKIKVCGWARSIRASNAFGFIELNDGSYFSNVQVVFEADKLENYTEISKQNVGAALIVEGTLELTPEAKQPFEIKAESIAVEGTSTPDFPIQKKRHTLEYLRTIPHLRPRTNLFSAVFRVRSEAAFAIHEFFHSRGFVYVHTPIITTSDAEGAGEMFRVTALDLDDLPKTEDGKVEPQQHQPGRQLGCHGQHRDRAHDDEPPPAVRELGGDTAGPFHGKHAGERRKYAQDQLQKRPQRLHAVMP